MNPEQPSQGAEIRASIAEWFNPLTSYFEIPDDIHREEYRAKSITFEVVGLGKFDLEIMWSSDDGWEDDKGIVVLPFGEDEVRIEDLQNQEQKIEARLLQLGILCTEEKYNNKNIPYQAEIALPSGRILAIPFTNEEDSQSQPSTGLNGWHDLEKKDGGFLLIPEVDNILSSIKLRIVPVPAT